MNYVGLFESHVTIEARDADALERFRAHCAGQGIKCVLIELARGVTRSQPMANLAHQGTFPQALREAVDLARSLAQQGFRVVRVKIEAAPGNADVPETDEQAKRLPPGNYFECHVKLVLPDEAAEGPVRAACEAHEAHLSANAFKQRPEGGAERFVTMRSYGVGRVTADARLLALVKALERTGFPLVKVVCEYCVFDSNQALDDGWLKP